MRYVRYLFVIASVLLVVGGASGTRADPRLVQVAAAISIGEAALATARAPRLTAAAEMLHALNPSGVDLLTHYSDEARFLARGDPALLHRLGALEPQPRAMTVEIRRIEPGETRAVLPANLTIAAFVPPLSRAACAMRAPGDIFLCRGLPPRDYVFKKGAYAVFLMQGEEPE